MRLFKKLRNKLSYDEYYSLSFIKLFFWEINWLKTLWINFVAFPLSTALKMPIIVSYNVKVKKVGKIILSNEVHPGMISLGVIKIRMFETNSSQTIFNNQGTLVVGGNMKIHPGAKLYISRNATLTVGKRVGFGANSKVVCFKEINIGNDFRISWNTQLFDTDFHFLYNIERDSYYPRSKPVNIGDNVFVGNGTTIAKGTILPEGCVVSCISKVSGDFSEYGKNLLISGNPAKVIKIGVNISNSWRLDKEEEIEKLLES